MTIPPQLVATARCLWWWQWQRLMDGLASADADGNYQRGRLSSLDAPWSRCCSSARQQFDVPC